MKTNSGYRIFLRLFALVIVPTVIACSAGGDNGDADSPSRCTNDADCGDSEVCVYGRCLSGGGGGGGGTNGDDLAGASGDNASNGASRNGSTTGTVSPGIAAAASVTTAFSDEICAEGSATATRLHPQVILLLDGSSSMREGYGDTTKWAAMRQALVNPNNGVVKTMESLIEFALVIYAGEYSNSGGECPVPGDVVPHAINNYNAIEAALPAESPGRRTPTGEALDAVCRALPGINDEGNRPQYVILATDGEPNSCEGGGFQGSPAYQSVIDAANRCCENGVTLYVVSLASVTPEFQAHLQQLANIGMCQQGGSAPVYSPQSPQQLSDDIGHLVGGALNCDVLINGTIVEGKECEGSDVRLGDQVLKCNDSNGWILAEPNLIRLQGQACEDFKNDPTKAVTATFPCEVLIPDDHGDDDETGGAGGSGGSGGSTGSEEPGTVIVI